MRSGELTARTESGGRWVAIVEAHAEALRAGAAAHDREATFPVDGFERLKRDGALAVLVPGDLGGLGVDRIHEWAVGLDRLGRADPSLGIALNMHLAATLSMTNAWRAAKARGDDEARARSEGILRGIAEGRLVVCASATEAGTDFLRPMCTATRDGDAWVLEGRKLFVTLSPVADLCMLGTRVIDTAGDRVAFAFVPTATPGFELQNDWDALGMRGSGSQSLRLRDCRVPLGMLQEVGEWGRFNPGLLMGRTLSNVTLLAVFLGIAERARELAVAAALAQSKPKHGGVIARSSGVQHLLGEIDIELACVRAILTDTLLRLDELLARRGGHVDDLETAHACMRDYQAAKWTVNHGAISIVSKAMDVCGGSAFMSGHELSRLYRDVRAGPFMQPFSPTEAREYVGRVALGLFPDG